MSPPRARRPERSLKAAWLPLGALLLALTMGCANSISTPANRYGLSIGIKTYLHATALSYTLNDAQEMRAALLAGGWSDVAYLAESSATKAGIIAAINALAAKAAADPYATIVVYYSGHGDSENGVSYICPYDTSFSGSTPNVSSMISVAELYQLLEAADCRNRLLILDSCYSGGFIETGSSYDSSPSDAALSGTSDRSVIISALANANTLLAQSLAKVADPSVMAISASGSEEESYDAPAYQNGAFTYFFLQAATQADSFGKGYVTATEAFSYAKRMLQHYWNSDPTVILNSEELLPHISGGAGDFVLFVNN